MEYNQRARAWLRWINERAQGESQLESEPRLMALVSLTTQQHGADTTGSAVHGDASGQGAGSAQPQPKPKPFYRSQSIYTIYKPQPSLHTTSAQHDYRCPPGSSGSPSSGAAPAAASAPSSSRFCPHDHGAFDFLPGFVDAQTNRLQHVFSDLEKHGIPAAKDLLSRVFEFGMTQAFSGQTDGTSRSGMARKP